MCLQTVSQEVIKKQSGVGYKIVRRNYFISDNKDHYNDKHWQFLVKYFNNARNIPRNKWLIAEQHGGYILANDGVRYKCGFHIYLTKPKLEPNNKESLKIVKVKWKNPLEIGTDYAYGTHKYRVIVVNMMLVPYKKEKERKEKK